MAKVSGYSAQGGPAPKPVVTPLPGSKMHGGIKGGQPSGGRSAPGASKYTSKSPMGDKTPKGNLVNKANTGSLPKKNSIKVHQEPHHAGHGVVDAGDSGSRVDSTHPRHPAGVEQHHPGYVARPVKLLRHSGYEK